MYILVGFIDQLVDGGGRKLFPHLPAGQRLRTLGQVLVDRLVAPGHLLVAVGQAPNQLGGLLEMVVDLVAVLLHLTPGLPQFGFDLRLLFRGFSHRGTADEESGTDAHQETDGRHQYHLHVHCLSPYAISSNSTLER